MPYSQLSSVAVLQGEATETVGTTELDELLFSPELLDLPSLLLLDLALLLDAFFLLRKDYPDYMLAIYGEGWIRDRLLKKIDELSLQGSARIYDFDLNI